MRDYPQIVKELLEENDISNVFKGTEKPQSAFIPHNSVFVAQYGGFQPDSMMATSEQIHQITVQIMVRSLPEDEQGSQTLANSIYDIVRNASPEGTMVIRPNAPPIRLSIDDTDRYRFSINITILAQE